MLIFSRGIQILRNTVERCRIIFARKAAMTIVNLATTRARLRLRNKPPLRVLVDSSVLFWAITHESSWIPTGNTNWGDREIETGYMARIPVHAPTNDERVYKQVRYLAGIAELARRGFIQLLTSGELTTETARQPVGRFKGYGYFDHNLFNGIKMELVDDYEADMFAGHTAAQRTEILTDRYGNDEPFKSLLAILGEKQSLDAWHIHTAEKHRVYCFLYIDHPLRESLAKNKKNLVIDSLATKVLMPSEFGDLIGIKPVDTFLLSYTDSDFPVRADLSWPNQRRNRPGQDVSK